LVVGDAIAGRYDRAIAVLNLRYLFIGLFSHIFRNICSSDYAFIKFDEFGLAYPNMNEKKYLVIVIGNILTVANQVYDTLF